MVRFHRVAVVRGDNTQSYCSHRFNMSKPFNKIKIKVYDLTDIFDFGRYQGCRVDSIADSDPRYFAFLAKNTTVQVSNAVKLYLIEKQIKIDFDRHIKEEVLPYLKQDMWGFNDMDYDDVPF
jgi:hypothetical protein